MWKAHRPEYAKLRKNPQEDAQELYKPRAAATIITIPRCHLVPFELRNKKRDNVERSSSRCLGGLNIPLVAHSTERRKEIFYGCYENLEEIGELRSETQLTAPAVQNGNLPPLRGHMCIALSLSSAFARATARPLRRPSFMAEHLPGAPLVVCVRSPKEIRRNLQRKVLKQMKAVRKRDGYPMYMKMYLPRSIENFEYAMRLQKERQRVRDRFDLRVVHYKSGEQGRLHASHSQCAGCGQLAMSEDAKFRY